MSPFRLKSAVAELAVSVTRSEIGKCRIHRPVLHLLVHISVAQWSHLQVYLLSLLALAWFGHPAVSIFLSWMGLDGAVDVDSDGDYMPEHYMQEVDSDEDEMPEHH